MSKQDENMIAYCGLCCLDCHGYQQKIPDLARDLRKELRQSKYKKFAGFLSEISFGKAFIDYDKCYEVLGAMVKFRCHKGCKDGGGPPFCKMRKCCQKKEIDGCWECDIFEECKKLDFLSPVHDDGHIKNLRILKRKGKSEFLNSKRHW
ncbi:MAG: DUF3795 domain-containing protein [Spirochaetota bacterium]|nr:MAG: DUF3795 domain-containing protein [Spirochaetota bacterium]